MNWPEQYKIIGDSLVCKLQMHESNVIELLNKDPRKQVRKPDCYAGVVTEVGSRCKLAKVGDKITYSRWEYSQSEIDDERTALREVDLVVVNGHCVNGYCAVKLYEPFKKSEDLIKIESQHTVARNFWGQIIDVDLSKKVPDTQDLKEGNIILFQYMDSYQYRVGQHTLIFKLVPDVVLLTLEEVKEKELVSA
jgi:hypothetical protein